MFPPRLLRFLLPDERPFPTTCREARRPWVIVLFCCVVSELSWGAIPPFHLSISDLTP